MAKRAKRRRRERKREKRQQRPQRQPVLAGAIVEATESRTFPGDPPAGDTPGDVIARDLGDEPSGGAGVREPRRPKPNAPLAGAAELPLPEPTESDLL
jgi:hypothetical protein